MVRIQVAALINCAALTFLATSASAAQATLEWLSQPDSLLIPAAVSDDGDTVVGTLLPFDSDDQPRVFRHDVTGGLEFLDDAECGTTVSAMSADGQVLVGDVLSCDDGTRNAFRWTQTDGFARLGSLGGDSSAADVSADGEIVVGSSAGRAFRWTATTGMSDLGTLAQFDATADYRATGVSADGSVIAGDASNASELDGPLAAFRWTASSGMERLDPNAEFGYLEQNRLRGRYVNGVSHDGRVFYGSHVYENVVSRFGGNHFTRVDLDINAVDMSETGPVLVGVFGEPPVFPGEIDRRVRAYLWRERGAYVKPMLADVYGVDDIFDRDFLFAAAISPDGRVLTGYGNDTNSGPGAWIARLDRVPEATDLAPLAPIVDAPLLSATLPASRSVTVGATATIFATIANPGSRRATGCRIASAQSSAADDFDVDYHVTNPVTNETVGEQNTPAAIPAFGSQSFVVGITPLTEFDTRDIELAFDCSNGIPATRTPGLNSVGLSASATPTPDVVAVAVTVPRNGIVTLPGNYASEAFAVATFNVGAAGTLTADTDTGAATLPLDVALCETDPAGVCKAAPEETVSFEATEGGTATFAAFVAGQEMDVASDAAANRVFVRFRDAGGIVRGATSVAVDTAQRPGQLPHPFFFVFGLAEHGVQTLPVSGPPQTFAFVMSTSLDPAEAFDVIVSADDAGAGLGLDLEVCIADVFGGACRDAPSPSQSLTIDESFFQRFINVIATPPAAAIATDLRRHRVYVRLSKPDGTPLQGTSFAIQAVAP